MLWLCYSGILDYLFKKNVREKKKKNKYKIWDYNLNLTIWDKNELL